MGAPIAFEIVKSLEKRNYNCELFLVDRKPNSESLLKKLSIGNAELGIFGRNLFLKAKNYPHFDPEQNALGVSNAQGLEFNALPQARSVGVSLKISL